MTTYSFQARNKSGRSEKGTLDAGTTDEALSILQSRNLVVVSLDEERSDEPISIGASKRQYKRVASTDLIIFARSLSAMTEAGLPLLGALEVVANQTRSRKLQAALEEITTDIRGGSTFRDAIGKHTSIFTNFWLSLIEMGEASGQLTKALEQIALHMEKGSAIKRKVISALFYPAILAVVAIGAIMIFMIFIIPQFKSLYDSMGGTLPGLTQFVLFLSKTIRENFLFGILGIALAVFLFKRYVATPHGKWQTDKLSLKLPVFGPLFQAIAAQEVTSNLSTLLKAGVPILHALDIVISGCSNKVVASVVEYMRTGAREGRPLAEPLARTDIFPPMVAQMIAVGEQTGKLPNMLSEAADFFEEEVSTAVERMMALLEPIMLVSMGLVVAFLLVSMYLPIVKLADVF